MSKVIKEIIILLLAALLIMLILAIVCYKFIPSKKIIPDLQYYQAPQDIQELIDSAKENEDKDGDVIFTYKSEPEQYAVTSSDLKGYQNTNQYVPGKANPFAAYSGTPTTENPSGEATSSGDSQTKDNNSSDNNSPKEAAVYSNASGTK